MIPPYIIEIVTGMLWKAYTPFYELVGSVLRASSRMHKERATYASIVTAAIISLRHFIEGFKGKNKRLSYNIVASMCFGGREVSLAHRGHWPPFIAPISTIHCLVRWRKFSPGLPCYLRSEWARDYVMASTLPASGVPGSRPCLGYMVLPLLAN